MYRGRSTEDGAHLCATRQGLVVARTMRLLVGSEYDNQLLLSMRGVPSNTRAAHAAPPLTLPPVQPTQPTSIWSPAQQETVPEGTQDVKDTKKVWTTPSGPSEKIAQ